ncbi:MAG TPA: ATP-binding protein [Acidimicrobiales bacterium]|nr:ATP-binding protein [Acidimicrobiales bacterium]
MYRVPIRTKLAAALTVPLLGLCVITGIEVVDTARDVERVHAQTDLARASIGPTGVLTRLQNERTWTVTELVGADGLVGAPVTGYDTAWGETDQAIAAFRDTIAESGETVRRAYRPALDNLSELQEIRASVEANTAPRGLDQVLFANDIYSAYAELTEPFFAATSRVAIAVDDSELRQWTTLAGRAARQVEVLADLSRQIVLDASFGDGIHGSAEIATVSRMREDFEQANQEFLRSPEPFASVVDASFDHDLVESFSANMDAALAGQQISFDAMLDSLYAPPEEGFMGLRDALTTGLNARADELNAAASGRERLYIGLAVATLGAAITLTWLVSRSITRPLRSLTRQATDMAERRLPDAVNQILDTPPGEDVSVPQVTPVAVHTRDEVADVAAALNTVQDTALDLAIEQAVLRRNIADSFVNLGRRNQNLLGRQLDFITELESNETDPRTLADLFRLDHLATRMRRNAESLLVLAGFDPPRKWTAPVRLSDVIRAALGEVEDYHRVSVRDIEPATIVGSAAADLAHLVAELVENALVFSPPDQTVDIRGRRRRHDGPSGDAYTLAVVDTGLGMTEADLKASNRRLAGTESFTIAPSKYLGHYVAGNLAARHGIRVALDRTPGNGITATVVLPADLLTSEPVTTAPVTPPHGQRAVRLSPGVQVPPPGLSRRPAAGASSARFAALESQDSGPQGIWPSTLAPTPERAGGPVAAGQPPAPRPAAPTDPAALPQDRPARRPPRSPVDAAASVFASLPGYAPGNGRPGGPRSRPGDAVPPPVPPAPGRAGAAAGPPTGKVPGDAGGPRPPAGGPLSRRVAGAQLPDTDVVRLRGRPAPPQGPGPQPSAAAYTAATDVHALLTTFTAGVQRGLEETRQRRAEATAAGNGRHGVE